MCSYIPKYLNGSIWLWYVLLCCIPNGT
jgi:hypothetical protein